MCLNKEESSSLRRRLLDCEVKELDMQTMDNAYKEMQKRDESADTSTFLHGAITGGIAATILCIILKCGGRE